MREFTPRWGGGERSEQRGGREVGRERGNGIVLTATSAARSLCSPAHRLSATERHPPQKASGESARAIPPPEKGVTPSHATSWTHLHLLRLRTASRIASLGTVQPRPVRRYFLPLPSVSLSWPACVQFATRPVLEELGRHKGLCASHQKQRSRHWEAPLRGVEKERE